MSKLKLIQAGVGGMGGAWWPVVQKSNDFEMAAIVDVAEPVLHEVGDKLGLSRELRFTNLQDAFDRVQADALLTVTPPTVHVEHARLAFARGLHLLTEKPIAHDLPAALEMVQLAKTADRQLLVAQNYRYSAAMQQLKKTFDEKPVGDFGHGHLDFYIPADFTGTFRETMEYPLLVDMAIHHLDLIRFITGRNITRVTSQTFKPQWSWYQHHPGLKMLLTLDGDFPFSYSGDWSARGKSTSWNGSWRLQCAEGSIHLDAENEITIGRCERWNKEPTIQLIDIPPLEVSGQVALLAQFARAIREHVAVPTSGADNLHSFAAVIAGVMSAQENRSVDLTRLINLSE